MSVSREAVRFSWPLASAADALSATPPTVAYSKEYFVDVTAADLAERRAGLHLQPRRPGASQPGRRPGRRRREGRHRRPRRWCSSTPPARAGGRQRHGPDGRPEQLKAAGAPFADGTSAFRLREELGAGTFQLRADGLGTSGDRYVVHVFDRGSTVSLELTTGARDYLHGQTLTVDAAQPTAEPARRSKVSSPPPGGRAWPLRFNPAA